MLYVFGEGVPNDLVLDGADFNRSIDYVQTRSFAWETYAAQLPLPHDTASVVVVDGGGYGSAYMITLIVS